MLRDKDTEPLTIDSIKDALLPTLENLFGRQSAKFDERFGRVDQQFEKVNERLEKVDQQFKIVDGHIQSVGEQFKYMELNFDQKLTSFKHDIVHQVKILIENDKRIANIVDLYKIAANDSLQVKDHGNRIEKLEQDITLVKNLVARDNA